MRLRLASVLAVAGGLALAVLVPFFDAAQPAGLSITRRDAARVADAEAAKIGIPVEKAWRVVMWDRSDYLDKELGKDAAWLRRAKADPALGPRLGFFLVTYFRPAPAEKFPSYGSVSVGPGGEVLSVRRLLRNEEEAPAGDEAQLRARADALVASHAFPGAPHPVFDGVRPTVLTRRTDRVFRYRVASALPTGPLDLRLGVTFAGSTPTGWELFEEYKDGRRFRYENGQQIAALFARVVGIFVLLGILAAIFVPKYHAGEVGVRTSTVLFLVTALLGLLWAAISSPWSSYGNNFGAIDARMTAVANGGFVFLFYLFPVCLLVFLAWAVGESRARERWGEKLASFDALVRRDPFNATVGESILVGLLWAPALAAAAFGLAALGVLLGVGQVTIGETDGILSLLGGPWGFLALPLLSAVTQSVGAILFNLAGCAGRKRRTLPVFLLLMLATSLALVGVFPPIGPLVAQFKFGVGAVLGAAALFFAADILAVAVGLLSAYLLVGFLPYLAAVHGAALWEGLLACGLPLLALLGVALAGLATRRPVVYTYEDLAPHVKRIVERERVKAEIDAANRIQAALLPSREPDVAGASVAAHYQAATEIGGDYFDFLPLGDGQLGVAFGDVSGHGLTSGIVMSMAKSALLVQVGYDPSPVRVMEVLNENVMKTAPKRILMTFFYGLLDVAAGELRFSSAGHLDPYLYRASERRLVALSAWGFPLGVRRREPFREHVATFAPGDRLILYSDGLIEATGDDGEPFGFPRFEDEIVRHGTRSAGEIKQALLLSVKRFTRNRPAEDDQTLVVIGFDEEARLRKAG